MICSFAFFFFFFFFFCDKNIHSDKGYVSFLFRALKVKGEKKGEGKMFVKEIFLGFDC